MTNERVNELDRLASSAIEECRVLGQRADNASLAFWRGVKSVVDELKMEPKIVGSGNTAAGNTALDSMNG